MYPDTDEPDSNNSTTVLPGNGVHVYHRREHTVRTRRPMPQLSIDVIFEAAIRIQLLEEKALTLVFFPDGVSIKFPTTRRLADELGVPHYYVLPYFAMMEQEDLVTRAERVGIMTTLKGSRKYIGMLTAKWRNEAESLLGSSILEEIEARTAP
jgi:hypothetical protein